MTLNSKSLAALIIPILFGGIFFSSLMGWWETESTKEAAVYTSGEFAGQANPADIRGSYTFGDVEKNFGVAPDKLAEAFSVETDDPASFQVKTLEEMYAESPEEIGTSSVRLFVAFYLGLPLDLSTDIFLPESAASLLGERSLTGEQAAYLETHTIPNLDLDATTEAAEPDPALNPDPGAGAEAEEPDPSVEQTTDEAAAHSAEVSAEESTERLVKGKTTFAELLEWGVTQAAIEQVMGVPMPASPGIKVKDFCTENNLSFETIKLALQAEVDQVE